MDVTILKILSDMKNHALKNTTKAVDICAINLVNDFGTNLIVFMVRSTFAWNGALRKKRH